MRLIAAPARWIPLLALLACRGAAADRATAEQAAAERPPAERPASAAAEAWREPAADRLDELVEQGEDLWSDLNCDGCHGGTRTATSGPAVAGIFGSPVKLADGRILRRDEAYLLRAINDPMAEIVDGYGPTMVLPQPPDDDEARALVCYLRSLGGR